MKREITYIIVLTLVVLIGYLSIATIENTTSVPLKRVRSTSSPKASVEAKKGRSEYFHRLLQDPATEQIPRNIRSRELKFAHELQKQNLQLEKSSSIKTMNWQEAGPNDVGGRTRALAVDINNSNTIIAGGISGGIWKSINNGTTWQIKSSSNQVLNVTSIAQDPRAGQTNNWYYSTGEYRGNTAVDQGYTHRFTGGGIYKSTDNGESWNLLTSTSDNDITKWSSQYDFISKIVVSPTTGSVFAASNAFGILISRDGGESFALSIGGTNHHIFSDVDVASDGTIIVVVSSPFSGTTPTNTPGVYKSTNDGQDWVNITPELFPETHQRSVIAVAPSNKNIAYVLTFAGGYMRFSKINISNGTSEYRHQPRFGNNGRGEINSQSNYNMVLAIKPDDENFVLVGGTSLFRSTDGFSTKPSNKKNDWIGGYHPTEFFYPNFHPDVHSFAFDPNNPNAMWWGHDGGLSYTSNITDTSYASTFPWENKNNGYNVTQFYTVAIPRGSGDNRIIGGTQDNGSPYFNFDGTSSTASNYVSRGDGGYAYWGSSYCYISRPYGNVVRVGYDAQGNPSQEISWSIIAPRYSGNRSYLFIQPYAINPSNENIMIFPSWSELMRIDQLNSLPDFEQYQTFDELRNASAPYNYAITALTFSNNNPANRLYYGAVDWSQDRRAPIIYRLDNADTATTGTVDISIDSLKYGSYIHNIAVNPDDGNEVIVVVSNYNVIGIYHSTDGGSNFNAIEGNLEGTEQNPGPSIRAATIIPTTSGTFYLVATSTGVYSTSNLNGNQTNWILEGANTLGNVVVNHIDSRKSDGRIAVGTHGRGIFVTTVLSTDVNELSPTPKNYSLSQNYPNPFNPSTKIQFSLPKRTAVSVKVYDMLGKEVAVLLNDVRNAGTHQIVFDVSSIHGGLASGVYIYRIIAGNFSASKKLMLLK